MTETLSDKALVETPAFGRNWYAEEDVKQFISIIKAFAKDFQNQWMGATEYGEGYKNGIDRAVFVICQKIDQEAGANLI